MGDYLNTDNFIENSAFEYAVEVVLRFLKENNITIGKFRGLGKCDTAYQFCEGNDFDIYREDVRFDEKNNCFTNDENEEFETMDFAVYICNEYGKWVTYI